MQKQGYKFMSKILSLALTFAFLFAFLGGCNSEMLNKMLQIEGDSQYCFAHYDGFVKEGKKYDYEDYFKKEISHYSARARKYYGAFCLGNKLFVDCRYVPLKFGGGENVEKTIQLIGCFDLGAEQITLKLLHRNENNNTFFGTKIGDYMAYTRENMDEIWLYDEDLEKTTLAKNGHEWKHLSYGLVEEIPSEGGKEYRIYDGQLNPHYFKLPDKFYFHQIEGECVYFSKTQIDKENYAVSGPYSYWGYNLSTMEEIPKEEVQAWLDYDPIPPYDVWDNSFRKYENGEYVALTNMEEMEQTSEALQRIYEINPNARTGIAGVLYENDETYMVIGNKGSFQASCAGNVSYTLIYRYEGGREFRFLGCAGTIRQAPNGITVIKLT